MNRLIALISITLIFAAGCAQEQPAGEETEPIGGQTDEHGCLVAAGYTWCEAKQKCLREWEEPCEVKPEGAALNYEQAYAYAQSGMECAKEGNITTEYTYNNDTNTWWFEMDIDKPGCSPACVVYEDTGIIELNWRCTGLQATAGITEEEARAIAENSSCMEEGNLTGTPMYNNYTATWWFDLDTVKEGCAPACVVIEENKTAEINWRCTGALPE